MRKTVLLSLGMASFVLLNSCGNTKNNDPNYIKVGISSGLEQQIAEAAQKGWVTGTTAETFFKA
mgnify:CR=1 FL=1